ncbi:phosphotransferase [Streptomyces sp. PLM4]|uniref:maltokinase N-terminal cap-like domain-containing protein n=1 Tax=Streptomyces sp. PLM4 TaxID=2929798 RepID=UPI0020625580|nr:phosphotransferase [Streptomyces sp. PLM4]BDH71148.1 hypothetical protein MTP06_45970 [Streptomyces sp. PLM4]
MSDASSTLVPSPASGGLLASLDPLLRPWLPRQRWFAGKGRPVTGFTLVAATELLPPGPPGRPKPDSPGLLHLLVRAQQPAGPGPGAATDPGDTYQLLIGVRRTLPPRLAPALIGRPGDGPLAGQAVYDALHDARLTEVLLERLRLPGRLGALRFARAGQGDIPAGLPARVLGAEQSNSSLVYGERLILKLFRRVVPGVNPDLELPRALAAGRSTRVPAPLAWLEADGGAEPLVLGVLQPFLRGCDDGWELALGALARGEDFSGEARALGRATAEVHAALAEALPTVTLGPARLAALAAQMTERLDAAAQAVPALHRHVPGLRTAFEAMADPSLAGTSLTAQRVHGDLHLGQCLRGPDGHWSLIDFEGEPVKPLAERRLPQPPVRDVAGMLRSFDYAARSHQPWAPEWADRCRDAYCAGYAEAHGRDPRDEPVLLRAFETDKAVYEALYEARHRPDWLPVPLAAVERLAAPVPAGARADTGGPLGHGLD